MAVFNEVLNITIDTAQFAAQMQQVEQIYQQSLANMPNLGNMGQVQAAASFQQAAQQITTAANDISNSVLQMNGVVVAAMTQVATAAQVGGAATAAGINQASRAAFQGGIDINRFSTGFESAMYRIPGRIAVLALLGAALGALYAPIKLVKEGFDTLAESTPEFKEVRTQLTDMLSIFEQVAARPIFDLVLKSMEALSGWLQTNRQYVDTLANAFGTLAAQVIKAFGQLLTTDLVKEGFKGILEIVVSITYALGSSISALSTFISLAGKGAETLAALMEQATHPLKNTITSDMQRIGGEVDEIIRKFNEQQHTFTVAASQADAAIEGKGQAPGLERGLVAQSQLKTSQEIMAQYRDELAEIKSIAKQKADVVADSEAKQTISKKTALEQTLAIDVRERISIDKLIEKYRALLKTATDLPTNDSSKLRAATDRLLLGGQGGAANSPYSQAEARDKAAIVAADEADIKERKNKYDRLEAEIKASYAEEVKTAKDAAAEMLETHKQAVGQEIEAERKRYEAQKAAIATLPTGAPGTPNADAIARATEANNTQHINQLKALAGAEVAAGIADDAFTAKQSENAKKVIDIRQKGAEEEAKLLGDKRVQHEVEYQREQQDLANLQEQMAEARRVQSGTTGNTPIGQVADARVAQLQAQIDVLQKRLTDQAQGANSASSIDQSLTLQRLSTLAKLNEEQAKLTNNKRSELEINKQILDIGVQQAQLRVSNAQAAVSVAFRSGDQAALKDTMDKLAIARAQLADVEQQRARANYSNSPVGQAQAQRDFGEGPSAVDRLMQSFGVNVQQVKQDLSNADTELEKFAIRLGEEVIPVLGKMVEAGVQFYEQLKKGQVLGAVGGALQNSSVTGAIGSAVGALSPALGALVPVIGPMIGQMFSAITNLFETSIQNMVTDINDQIQAINQQAQLKQIGILQQITELRQEEQTAISELGGKKKAQSQLQGILQSLNSEIAQLQFQAAQTIQQFNDMVAAANTGTAAGNAVATQWLNTWQSINQQVEAYVQAGGSLATAAAYLNQQLQAQQQTLTDQLNQGNQTAISDALQLNQLEQQKVDMLKQEYATEFQLLNADSVERRTASAVATGVALTNQRNQFALQMQNMNQQIALEQGRVAAEGQIFNLNQSIASLQNEQNALNIAALNQQLEQYKEMQILIAATQGVNYTPGNINPNWGLNGIQAPIPGLNGVAGNAPGGSTTVGTINVTINGAVTTDNVSDIASEIAANIRSGRTTFTTAGG